MAVRQARQRDFLTTFSEGRSGRWQFWTFYAFVAVPAVGLLLVQFIGGLGSLGTVPLALSITWLLLFFVPLTVVTARRYHDIGKSGWWSVWQVAAVFAAILIGMVYPQAARPDREPGCFGISLAPNISGSGTGFGGLQPEPLSPEKQAACDAADAKRAAFNDRVEALGLWLAGIVALTHIATLIPLFRPSQPGTNKYGPNPHEVPQ